MNKPIPTPYFEIQSDFKGESIWVLKSPRGDEIARSGESYKMRAKCTKAVNIAKEMMGIATEIRNCDTV